MTRYEEAKKWFEVQRVKTMKRIENCRNKQNFADDEMKNLDRKLEAYTIAIEAIGKQIPKKPIEAWIFGKEAKCPICLEVIPTLEIDGDCLYSEYCDCGQHINWSKEDEK